MDLPVCNLFPLGFEGRAPIRPRSNRARFPDYPLNRSELKKAVASSDGFVRPILQDHDSIHPSLLSGSMGKCSQLAMGSATILQRGRTGYGGREMRLRDEACGAPGRGASSRVGTLVAGAFHT